MYLDAVKLLLSILLSMLLSILLRIPQGGSWLEFCHCTTHMSASNGGLHDELLRLNEFEVMNYWARKREGQQQTSHES